jgi:hypothetical protein
VTETPSPRRERLARAASRVGLVASALAVFTSGWLAMSTDDWRKVTVITLLGGVAGLVAAWFARRAR